MIIAPYRLGLTATYERPDGSTNFLRTSSARSSTGRTSTNSPAEYLSEYETIHMSVDLTADERVEHDEEYQIYRDYVDSHEFDLWKEDGYAEFLKRVLRPARAAGAHRQATCRANRPNRRKETRHARQPIETSSR